MPIAGTTTLFLEAVTGRARTILLHDNYDLQHQLSSFNLLVVSI